MPQPGQSRRGSISPRRCRCSRAIALPAVLPRFSARTPCVCPFSPETWAVSAAQAAPAAVPASCPFSAAGSDTSWGWGCASAEPGSLGVPGVSAAQDSQAAQNFRAVPDAHSAPAARDFRAVPGTRSVPLRPGSPAFPATDSALVLGKCLHWHWGMPETAAPA